MVIIVAFLLKEKVGTDFLGAIVDKNLPANAGVTGSIPGLGRFHMPRSQEAWELQLLKPML